MFVGEHYKKVFNTESGNGVILKNFAGEIFLLRAGKIFVSSEESIIALLTIFSLLLMFN